ncbi:MAG: PTS sugar transporter subunit IIB [Candidatus Eisenbacteria bacterium]|uniref:PTS sugar transporter subunit IIB n=1 Tax=Eiseniibacteriota bacterium TaxID=2212470 RepID=A0A7Y2E648_UNCEI|nr:PTS sugar transporter subunit IIB [Candidatus Eisenbacteria bacterium]
MSEIFTRFDERLIHGQVMVAWQPYLQFREIRIVDEELAQDDWEQELLQGASGGVPVLFSGAEGAKKWYDEASPNLLVLIRSFDSLRALKRSGANLQQLNLGGVHYRKDRRRILNYLFVSADELEVLRELVASDVTVEARDVPQSDAINLNQLFAEGRLEFDNLPDRSS